MSIFDVWNSLSQKDRDWAKDRMGELIEELIVRQPGPDKEPPAPTPLPAQPAVELVECPECGNQVPENDSYHVCGTTASDECTCGHFIGVHPDNFGMNCMAHGCFCEKFDPVMREKDGSD